MSASATSTPVRVWENVTASVFAQDIAPLAQPAVLRGLVGHWPAVQRARRSIDDLFAYLRPMCKDTSVQCFAGAPDMGGFFNYSDDLKGFNFQIRQLPLTQLMQQLGAGATPEAPYLYAGGVNVPEHLPAFAHEHNNPLLDDQTEQLVSVWLGNRTRVPAHWDLPRNLACVIAGRRRFTLFPTEQVRNLYIGPLERTLAGQPSSLVDPMNPDLERFPRFAQAQNTAQVATLEPGDAIYIPSLWLHHVESLDDIGMLANFWWREGAAAHMFTPLLTLMHGLLSIRRMPDEERQAWRHLFDHFVFNGDEADLEHLPPEAHGVLGKLTPADEVQLRQFLARRLVGGATPQRNGGQ